VGRRRRGGARLVMRLRSRRARARRVMAGLACRPVRGAALGQHELVDTLIGGEPGHESDGDDGRMNRGMEVAHLWISSAWGPRMWSPACSMPRCDLDFTLRYRYESHR